MSYFVHLCLFIFSLILQHNGILPKVYKEKNQLKDIIRQGNYVFNYIGSSQVYSNVALQLQIPPLLPLQNTLVQKLGVVLFHFANISLYSLILEGHSV